MIRSRRRNNRPSPRAATCSSWPVRAPAKPTRSSNAASIALAGERAALDEILVVTFTEAAAAEMNQRLRRVLDEKSQQNPHDSFFAEQLALFDAAHMGTLHSFCFKLVREHFYELGLDPQPAVLDEGGARLLADEMLDEELQAQYAGGDEFAGVGSKADSNLRRRAR